MIPLSSRKEILASWKLMIETLEDQEDTAILREWMEQRVAGEAKTISLAALEQELIENGLLPG